MAFKMRGMNFGVGTGSSPAKLGKKKKEAEEKEAQKRREERLRDYDENVATEKTQVQIDREAQAEKYKKQDEDYAKYLAEENARGQLLHMKPKKSPVNLLKNKKKRNFKKKVRKLKKANKTQPGQYLEQVGPSSYKNVNTNIVYQDPKNVIKKDSRGNVMDYDYKQKKGKFKKIK